MCILKKGMQIVDQLAMVFAMHAAAVATLQC